MVVSNAFEDLSTVVARLEAADADVSEVGVCEQAIGTDGEITAELTVAVPLFAASTIREDITIEAENADLRDQRVSLDLTVTIPVTDESPRAAATELTEDATAGHESDTTPAYKDPDALATAYAECDTFPAMTAALGVDVTAETVRRHAIKYDIHDPSSSSPRPDRSSVADAETSPETETTETDGSVGATDVEQTSTKSSTDTADRTDTTGSQGQTDTTVEVDAADETHSTSDDDQRQTSTEPVGDSPRGAFDPSGSDRDSQAPTDEEPDGSPSSTVADRSMAELLSKTDEKEGENTVVADGLGISSDLTVGKFAAAVNQSRTVHEAKQHLGMSQDNTRQLLRRLDLIHFVSHPLTGDQLELTPAEVVHRIDRERD